MPRMIEKLQSRMMFNATLGDVSAPVKAHEPAIHATVHQATPLHFSGTALNTTSGKVAAQLQMTLTKNSAGYRAELVGTDPGSGKPTRFLVQTNVSGHFAYDTKQAGGKLHLVGQLSADQLSISGTFTETRVDGSSAGTFALSRSDSPSNSDQGQMTNPTPSPTPTPTPKPTPAPASKGVLLNGSRYVGTATSTTGKESALTMVVLTTNDGSTFGTLKHANHDGTTDTITVKFDTSGHFIFTGDNKADGITIGGRSSADGKTITGSYMTGNGTTTEAGSLTLTRT